MEVVKRLPPSLVSLLLGRPCVQKNSRDIILAHGPPRGAATITVDSLRDTTVVEHWMPPFRPAAAKLPKSHVRVPFKERPQVKPIEMDKAPKQEPMLWARRLPYKLVQGSHIGHGIRMEPSRKVHGALSAPGLF